MSRIDELVSELCPDGVEYKTLAEMCKSGKKGMLKQEELEADGKYPVVNGGTSLYGRYHDWNNPREGVTLSSRGENAGHVSYVDEPFWAGALCYPLICKDHSAILPKFLYFSLKKDERRIKERLVSRGGIPALNKADVLKIQIPVPPIEVQREIVRILDAFTALTDELTAKLAEEATARKQQYGHYRDQLLSQESLEVLDGKPVEMKRLEEVFDMKNGYTPSKKKAEYWENGEVNWFRMEDIRANGNVLNDSIQKVSIDGIKGGKLFEANSLIVATSATIGEHALVTVPFMCNQRFTCLTRKPAYRNSLDMKFVSHYASKLDEYCLENTNQGGFASVSMPAFKSFPIPIPSLATQQKVVDILDRFDALTTSLTDGLPAEIEARKAQYEYYRDRLLDFPRKKVTAS